MWIVDLPAGDPRYIGVCRTHTELLTVPEGWTITEERHAQAALFEVASPRRVRRTPAQRVAAATGSLAHLDHRRPADSPAPLQLFEAEADAEDPTEPAREIVAEPTPDSSWVGDAQHRHTELHDVDEESPLLQRAFRASRAS